MLDFNSNLRYSQYLAQYRLQVCNCTKNVKRYWSKQCSSPDTERMVSEILQTKLLSNFAYSAKAIGVGFIVFH